MAEFHGRPNVLRNAVYICDVSADWHPERPWQLPERVSSGRLFRKNLGLYQAVAFAHTFNGGRRVVDTTVSPLAREWAIPVCGGKYWSLDPEPLLPTRKEIGEELAFAVRRILGQLAVDDTVSPIPPLPDELRGAIKVAAEIVSRSLAGLGRNECPPARLDPGNAGPGAPAETGEAVPDGALAETGEAVLADPLAESDDAVRGRAIVEADDAAYRAAGWVGSPPRRPAAIAETAGVAGEER